MLFLRVFCVVLCVFYVCESLQIHENRRRHQGKELTDEQVHKLGLMGNTTYMDVILDAVLVPRVVGTKNHKKVRNFIVAEMRKLGWSVEMDTFEDVTPNLGKLTFSNVIGTSVVTAQRFLALACHYDSKYTREYDFIGATDSAVPCAMMLNLAAQLNDLIQSAPLREEITLKLIFFDGEEAFRQWSAADSIYGARHLAQKWQNAQARAFNEPITELDRLDVLLLLDLLGTPDPKFYSYFPETEKWYVRLAQAENRLAEMGALRQYSKDHPQQTYFAQRSVRAHIEDDHVPFLVRNVPILHVIPTPFPSVWHTEADNRNAIDMHTVENLNKILRVFVAEYLHLSV